MNSESVLFVFASDKNIFDVDSAENLSFILRIEICRNVLCVAVETRSSAVRLRVLGEVKVDHNLAVIPISDDP